MRAGWPGNFMRCLRRGSTVVLAIATAVAFAGARVSSGEAQPVEAHPRAGEPQTSVIPNRAPLQPNSFDPLPLGTIAPRGWLRDQLAIQGKGLTGHLDEFWPDLMANSGWKGGNGESWERGPYFADGLLPLAYQLNDSVLIGKAKSWVEWTLTHQQANGQIGPAGNNDWWPRMVMLKVLTQYAEVSGDARVEPLLARYFAFELAELPKRPLRDWGKFRWHDNVLAVLWLYNRHGDAKLLELAKLLRQQGFDWKGNFEHFPFPEKTTTHSLGLDTKLDPNERALAAHGVNNAMALKASPLSYVLTGDAGDRSAVYQQIGELERYHLLPNGMYSGDEHLAGDNPSQGVELCTVVESMFSWEENLAVLGDARFADRLERVAFNALPGTISDDMWSHQYDQQPNQISCTHAARQWSTNGDESNLFGLEPNFGCCTANMHQGWPKFAQSLWMATPDGGLAATAYAPNQVRVRLGKHKDEVRIDEETEYPFRGTVTFTVHVAKPMAMPLVLRIPGWAESATVRVNDAAAETIEPTCAQTTYDGRMHVSGEGATPDRCLFHAVRRTWKDGDRVTLAMPMRPRVTRWYHASAAVERGPLLFSLRMDQGWSKVKQHGEQSADWQITSDTAWNYALAVDPAEPARSLHVRELPLGAVPFSAKTPAVEITTSGAPVADWKVSENSAGPLPESPVRSEEAPTLLTLIPYAAAKLRITAFPLLEQRSVTAALQ